MRFGVLLADEGSGTSATFGRSLDARGLRWAVGIANNQTVHDAHVQIVGFAGVCQTRSPARPRRFSPHRPGA